MVKYLVMGALLSFYSTVAFGQTRFDWPVQDDIQTNVNLQSYRSGEACLAAVMRVNRYLGAFVGIYRDTTPYSFEEALEPLAKEAREMGHRCSKNVSVGDIPLEDANIWADLLLKVGREADAKDIINRRLRLIQADSQAQYAAVSNSLALVYLSNRPADLASAESLTVNALQVSTDHFGSKARIISCLRVYVKANAMGNEPVALRWAARAAGYVAEMTRAEKQDLLEDRNLVATLWKAVQTLSRTERIESLRESTQSYVDFFKAFIEKNLKMDAERLLTGWGSIAPQLTGTYQFVSGPGNTYTSVQNQVKIPVKGAVNLVIFANRIWCHYVTRCFQQFSIIRRLKESYPDLQVTLVAQTYGYYDEGNVVTPLEEAGLYAAEWLEHYQLPANLLVAETPHFFLPGYDKRRINQVVDNAREYNFSGGNDPSTDLNAFLIDKEGVFVASPSITRTQEQELHDLVQVLTERKLRDQ